MARVGVFLLLAFAALAQASLPTNNVKDVIQILRQRASLKAKPLCNECEKVVTLLKKVVDNPKTEAELRQVLTDVCNLPLVSNFKDGCMNLLVTDVIALIHEVQALFDNPTQFCDTIHLCDSDAPGMNMATKRLMLSVMAKVLQNIHKPSPQMEADTCGMCTAALTEVKRWLEVPQLIEQIQAEVEKVCKYLGPFQQDCDNLIQTAIPKLFGWIVDALCDPEQTCAALHLCKQNRTYFNKFNRVSATISHPNLDRFLATITEYQNVNKLNFGCLACKTGVEAAEKVLSKDSVLTSLTKDITDLVCKIMPASQKDGCFDFLGIYGKAALQLTVNEWTPSEICSAVHACDKVTLKQLLALETADKSKVVCDACKAASKILAAELQKPELQQEIIDKLSRVCQLLPGKYEFKFESYIQTYIPYMLDNIVALSLVPQLCTVLHLC